MNFNDIPQLSAEQLEKKVRELEAQIQRLRTMSTVEMMCENENVRAHVTEWENRCFRAESDLEFVRALLATSKELLGQALTQEDKLEADLKAKDEELKAARQQPEEHSKQGLGNLQYRTLAENSGLQFSSGVSTGSTALVIKNASLREQLAEAQKENAYLKEVIAAPDRPRYAQLLGENEKLAAKLEIAREALKLCELAIDHPSSTYVKEAKDAIEKIGAKP